MHIKSISLILLQVIFYFGCNESSQREQQESIVKSDSLSSLNIKNIVGNYVDEDYSKRAEGYDWVAVTVIEISPTVAYIRVQSRSDKKKPTCTFEGKGILKNNSILEIDFEGKIILLSFEDNSVNFSTKDEADQDFLMYFCSGGGSLAGTYKKINEPLDDTQLRPSGYNQSLSLQGITFDIHASQQGSMNILIIQPSGLEIDNRPQLHEIDGNVNNAEIEDLNSDGSPEVLVYITSAGSGSYGSVIGYSVNNKKSMSQIYFPPITENPEISKGYMGHDEFAIIETTFAQRFPVYKEGDSNSDPTGGMRQVQYKLVDGEAGRIFKVDKVVEF